MGFTMRFRTYSTEYAKFYIVHFRIFSHKYKLLPNIFSFSFLNAYLSKFALITAF